MLLKGNEDKLIPTKWYIIKSKEYNFTYYGQASIRYDKGKRKWGFYIFTPDGIIEPISLETFTSGYPDITVELVVEMNISLSSKQITEEQILNFKSDIKQK